MRDGQNAEIVRVIIPVTLQRAEIIRITKFIAQLLEYFPVSARSLVSHLALQMFLEVVRDAVVIQKRIVHIKEENDVRPSRFSINAVFHVTNARTDRRSNRGATLSKAESRPEMRLRYFPAESVAEVLSAIWHSSRQLPRSLLAKPS